MKSPATTAMAAVPATWMDLRPAAGMLTGGRDTLEIRPLRLYRTVPFVLLTGPFFMFLALYLDPILASLFGAAAIRFPSVEPLRVGLVAFPGLLIAATTVRRVGKRARREG